MSEKKLSKRKTSHAVGHWWWERATAVALIPLSLWFFYHLLTTLLSPDAVQLQLFLAQPFNSFVLAVLLVMLFIHTKMGNEVIIEDYVKGKWFKPILCLNTLVCYGALIVAVGAVITMYLQR